MRIFLILLLLFTFIGDAAVAAAGVKRAPAPKAGIKSGSRTKSAPRIKSAPKRSPRVGSKRRAPRKGIKAASFKPYEISGWPQVSTLIPPPTFPDAAPPRPYINCTACTTPLISTAYSLIGTRYRLGGTSPETGFDCSGFTKYVYQAAAAYSLPSNAPSQFKFDAGVSVSKSELQPGDLVFFRTRRGWHVGMFVGDNSFIHAPNRRKTVSVSPMDDAYWRRAFIGARRIALPEFTATGDASNN